uniref:Uncharacterized protein n=1 Tax=Anolis carolinensis TaxID=28377 RepID=A0A803T421_ANOCA
MPSAHSRKRRISAPRRAKLKNKKSRPIRKNHNIKHGRQAKRNSVKKHKMSDKWTLNALFHKNSKTLQKLEGNKSMTIKAKGIMMSFVRCLYKWVSAEAERFRRARNRPSIGSLEMRSALILERTIVAVS